MIHSAISEARRALVLDFPFFGVLSLKLDLVEDRGIPTFATDGKSIRFNPEFAAGLTRHELMGVIAHEVLHCANGHQWRRQNRDHRLWNKACDYAINPVLLDAKLILPEGGLADPAYKGMSAEAIYDRLLREQQDQQQAQKNHPQDKGQEDNPPQSAAPGQGGGQDEESEPDDKAGEDSGSKEQGGGQPGAFDGDKDFDPSDFGSVMDCAENEMPEMKADWTEAVLNAARQAEKAGRLPAGIDRIVEGIKNPPQSWRAILRRFIQQAVAEDYSWKMPNGRYLYAGLYLPALHSESMGEMVIAVDTSGSINNDLVVQFQEELNAIADEVKPERIHVLSCDARVHVVETFERGEPVTIRPKGGGGTDFRPVFSWIEEEGIAPACLVYLTDMEGRFPDQAPNYPVIWANFGRIDYPAPFGDVVSVRN